MIESGVTFDYGVLLMDNEFARMNKYVIRGIPVSDATLMVDEIHAVGSQEDFLSRDSTFKMMREHQSDAKLIDRRVREEWEMDGSTDLYHRATEEAKRIIAEHKPTPLSDDEAAKVAKIVKDYEKKQGGG
jgi:trimethylamine--corrinoid protein Co-methyltransferase